ncbi:class I SAM-dependent DNA methyltransferase [Phreatobacter stygius]|uniref:Methyltransferase domain-containing protein n=1 Tax=Phreatobacter stygius TaxID=1940610 RepID=A0A4D7AWP8_9HYPH|nr:methyltransferase domain-containing protein [Phreatobacter stygius]QCI65559.1 methyltransferase domain-containing protein [Phreatobacter stygius]
MTNSVFRSSGDFLADRRYDYAMAAKDDGDLVASADLLRQALEIAPGWAAGWFALGEVELSQDLTEPAIMAFRAAGERDPADALGAGLMLARLGAGDGATAMSAAYVATLFDQYAPRFDQALRQGLGYRGPEILTEAVERACGLRDRQFRFARMLDLGCGTGLAAAAFKAHADAIDGVDLSRKMVEIAKTKGLYATVEAGDLLAFLGRRPSAGADLIVAADVFVYCADLGPIFAECARVLQPGGLLAFTVESHDGKDAVLGAGLRYAHAETYLRTVMAGLPLGMVSCDDVSSRLEGKLPVPGLVVVAERLG